MANITDAKIMIPGAFTKGKKQKNFYLPPTRFLFGADAVQGKQQFFFGVNLLNKVIHGYYSKPIAYADMERVEYCEGTGAKDTLKIITKEINGTYYFCLSELCASQLEKVKALLEACIEEGGFGEKAAALAEEMKQPLEKSCAGHLKFAAVAFLIMLLMGWYFNVYLAIIPCMFAAFNARVSKYPALSFIPWIVEFIFVLMVAGI